MIYYVIKIRYESINKSSRVNYLALNDDDAVHQGVDWILKLKELDPNMKISFEIYKATLSRLSEDEPPFDYLVFSSQAIS